METKFDKYKRLKDLEDIKHKQDIEKLVKVQLELDLVLNSFKTDNSEDMITFRQLSNFKFNEEFDLGNGVTFKRVKHPSKKVYFITEMNPEDSPTKIAEFGRQKHDCKELCEVLEGELIEIREGFKKYDKGDIVIYPKNFIHKPSSSIKSKYGVEFLEP